MMRTGLRWLWLTVLVVAEVYLAVIAGLTIAVGGPAGLRNQLALHRPRADQIGGALAVLALAVLAALVISVASSPLSGGVLATLRAIVRSGSDEARMSGDRPREPLLERVEIVVEPRHRADVLQRRRHYIASPTCKATIPPA